MPVFFILPLLFWVAILGPGFYLAFRFLRAFEARNGNRDEIENLRGRLARIEDSVESMGVNFERILEAQEFTTKLLSDRNTPDSPPE